MEGNWIEIKRFLNDYKKSIIIGSILFSLLFTLAMVYIDSREEEAVQNEDNFEPSPAEILNDAQPAFFQLYIEYEDGTPYTNYAIINQYFNLSTVKEEASEDAGVDIESVEESIQEEIFLNNLDEEIKVINVSRNDNHLYTMSFNTGNERANLAISEYYFDLIFNEESDFFSNKITYLFVEPSIAERKDEELEAAELEAAENLQPKEVLFSRILDYVINIIIGLVLGIVLMIGLGIVKAIFEKKLNYSFAYDVTEGVSFILYDPKLQNAKNVSQFVAAPFNKTKIVVSEQEINPEIHQLLTGKKEVSFDKELSPEVLLINKSSLSDVEVGTPLSEIIILVHSKLTTREWFKIQQEFATIYKVPTKIIQINN